MNFDDVTYHISNTKFSVRPRLQSPAQGPVLHRAFFDRKTTQKTFATVAPCSIANTHSVFWEESSATRRQAEESTVHAGRACARAGHWSPHSRSICYVLTSPC